MNCCKLKKAITEIAFFGNVVKNSWWFSQQLFIIFDCQFEEEVGSAGEQPASNRIDLKQ